MAQKKNPIKKFDFYKKLNKEITLGLLTYSALLVLEQDGPMRQTDLALRLAHTMDTNMGTATKRVRELKNTPYINEGRWGGLELTSEGKKLRKEIKKAILSFLE